MKMAMWGLTTLGVGGAAVTGAMSGHDVERVVAKPPEAVYAAISSMALEGERIGPASEAGQAKIRVEKEAGRSVRYEVLLDGKTLAEFELGVEAEDGATPDGPAATRLTADLDVDKAAIGKLVGEDGPRVAAVPDALVNIALAKLVDEMAADIEAGKPLPRLFDLGSRMETGGERFEVRRAIARRAQAAAAAPQATAAPMMDPNASTRAFLKPDLSR